MSAGQIEAAARIVSRALWTMGTPARLVLIGLIRLYRVTLSGVLGGRCRFHPTCSAYAEDAIRARGALVGTALAAWRLLRCSPLTKGGIDPAPGPRAARRPGALEYESVIPPGPML